MKHPRIEAQARVETPLGPLTVAVTAKGLAGIWFDGQAHHPGALAAPVDASHPKIVCVSSVLDAYFRGQRPVRLPTLDAQGTAFQQAVWRALGEIAPGTTTTYGEIAHRIGRPAAVRAVGAAVGRNPISILVPCHRVIGRDGSLTGYAGGLPRKQALLAHEGWSGVAAA
ncbi:MAG: methylated-DNA--[protein]-cysteine S-methyltransferase [Rubrivivax sp.]